LDGSVGVHVSGMRVPALDDDHGIPGVRRGFIEFRDYSNVIGRMKMKDDMMGDEDMRNTNIGGV
jgi:hypothetical protein